MESGDPGCVQGVQHGTHGEAVQCRSQMEWCVQGVPKWNSWRRCTLPNPDGRYWLCTRVHVYSAGAGWSGQLRVHGVYSVSGRQLLTIHVRTPRTPPQYSIHFTSVLLTLHLRTPDTPPPDTPPPYSSHSTSIHTPTPFSLLSLSTSILLALHLHPPYSPHPYSSHSNFHTPQALTRKHSSRRC